MVQPTDDLNQCDWLIDNILTDLFSGWLSLAASLKQPKAHNWITESFGANLFKNCRSTDHSEKNVKRVGHSTLCPYKFGCLIIVYFAKNTGEQVKE
jgi:hypothetical protein